MAAQVDLVVAVLAMALEHLELQIKVLLAVMDQTVKILTAAAAAAQEAQVLVVH
jgi:hypothetical protein